MSPEEKDATEEEKVSPASTNDGPDGTAPDSETQSSAASQDGGRTAPGGSRAPNDPAEGA